MNQLNAWIEGSREISRTNSFALNSTTLNYISELLIEDCIPNCESRTQLYSMSRVKAYCPKKISHTKIKRDIITIESENYKVHPKYVCSVIMIVHTSLTLVICWVSIDILNHPTDAT